MIGSVQCFVYTGYFLDLIGNLPFSVDQGTFQKSIECSVDLGLDCWLLLVSHLDDSCWKVSPFSEQAWASLLLQLEEADRGLVTELSIVPPTPLQPATFRT